MLMKVSNKLDSFSENVSARLSLLETRMKILENKKDQDNVKHVTDTNIGLFINDRGYDGDFPKTKYESRKK